MTMTTPADEGGRSELLSGFELVHEGLIHSHSPNVQTPEEALAVVAASPLNSYRLSQGMGFRVFRRIPIPDSVLWDTEEVGSIWYLGPAPQKGKKPLIYTTTDGDVAAMVRSTGVVPADDPRVISVEIKREPGRPPTGKLLNERRDFTLPPTLLDFISYLIGAEGNLSAFLRERVEAHPQFKGWIARRILEIVTDASQQAGSIAGRSIADKLGIPRKQLGASPPTVYDEALQSLIREGKIVELQDLGPRYRVKPGTTGDGEQEIP
jgi:hypothetical protein